MQISNSSIILGTWKVQGSPCSGSH